MFVELAGHVGGMASPQTSESVGIRSTSSTSLSDLDGTNVSLMEGGMWNNRGVRVAVSKLLNFAHSWCSPSCQPMRINTLVHM